MQQTRVPHIFNDNSQVLDGWRAVTGWLSQAFFPELVGEGVRAVAWVKARDWPARLIIEEALRHTKPP
ncbi:MAG: hypothetical protein ACRYFZ_15015 [Janthinobacterium lividum]